jgi:hypothetical protein
MSIDSSGVNFLTLEYVQRGHYVSRNFATSEGVSFPFSTRWPPTGFLDSRRTPHFADLLSAIRCIADHQSISSDGQIFLLPTFYYVLRSSIYYS